MKIFVTYSAKYNKHPEFTFVFLVPASNNKWQKLYTKAACGIKAAQNKLLFLGITTGLSRWT